mgnify:CR=1 FL=1
MISSTSSGEIRDKLVHNHAHDMLTKLPKNFISHEVDKMLAIVIVFILF